MSARYVLVIGDSIPERSELLQRLSDLSGLAKVFSSPRMAALVSPSFHYTPVGAAGCIIGSLFHRHCPSKQLASLTAIEEASITSSEGQALVGEFWGGYVAAISTPNGVRILRDPSGTLPCYYAASGSFVLFASDAELLFESGIASDIDFGEIGRQLYRALVPAAPTALIGIRELLAGFAVRVSATDIEHEPCWSPWDHVSERGEHLGEELTEELARIVRHAVDGWTSSHGPLLLSVSGGLDSSILAACLATSGAEATCLTMYADDPVGDERMFARALCNHLRLPLIERPYLIDDIDITEPLAPHLPRPRDRTQANAYERVHLEVAKEVGAEAFVTGNGGDAVFGYSQSAAPVADLYLARGFGTAALAALLDVCRQTGCNIFDALGQAWRLAHRAPSSRIAPKPLLLNGDLVAATGPAELQHPWLAAPSNALPGKAAHVASILRVQSHLEAGRSFQLPVLSPLVSQPILEACLAIPSWEWRAGGRDRSAARRAFAGELPPIVIDRRVKGSPSGFGAKLLDHFRAPIRERLLGGQLVSHQIIDKAAIELILSGEKPIPHAERVRILELVNAEAWIDHWKDRHLARPATPNIKLGVHGRPRVSGDPIP